MKVHNFFVKFKFQHVEKFFYLFLILLAIFIAGVQIGISQGRALELEQIRIIYGYEFTD